ncbi:hypothetical protein XELAEV_18035937mg [Xenopus laevis]|uniref:Uncharacterized protein n=1 Tax=Xenopus laevis TaxID=8355 RepID=A0A974CIR4_XENLA|nr:hypothetical protein XELAEV_18035937mg [Xenopus laevis]
MSSFVLSKTIGAHVSSTLVKTKPREVHTLWGGRSKGMFTCLSCVQCPFVLKGREFVHPQTGQHIQLRGHYTCISKFAIYVLTCPCGLIYVGNTTLPVSKHFLDMGHTTDQLKFMVLDLVPPIRRGGDRELKLKRREHDIEGTKKVTWIGQYLTNMMLYQFSFNADKYQSGSLKRLVYIYIFI